MVLVVGTFAGMFGCSLFVSTSDLSNGAPTENDSSPNDGDATANDGPAETGRDDGSTPILDAGSDVSEGGCPPSGTLFCDDFDEVTSPSSQWSKTQPIDDGGFRLDLTDYVSPPHSVSFFAPVGSASPTQSFNNTVSGALTKRTRISFDIRAPQIPLGGVFFALSPEPYPEPYVQKYFISLRFDNERFAYNTGVQLRDGGPDDLYQDLGGDPKQWTHFDLDFDTTSARVDLRMNGVLRVSDTFPSVPGTGINFDIGIGDLQNTSQPCLIRFDNVSVTAL